ncbi:MAG: YdaU family protein [Proteobacteria bacterium]|nr:YdaU family protein [Pseudomonadota bacterium]
MNYYEHHLGDYAKDTAHLSMLEHGAYRLLLDRYYSTEEGIPAAQAHRVARARSKEERDAVDTVLQEFFTLQDGVWVNGRAEEEILKAQAKINAAQTNGKKGGRPRKNGNPGETQQKPSGFSVGSENETQTKAHQAPSTKHQTPIKEGACTSTSLDAGEGPFAHTPAGDVGRAFQRAGVDPDQVNLADVRLAALLAQGVTPEEFEGLAREAVRKSIEHPFGWVLKVLPERRAEAAGIKAAPSVPEVPWFDTAKGVRETGLKLGCGDWSDEIYAATGEQYPTYKRRVLAAARRAGMPMPEDIPA